MKKILLLASGLVLLGSASARAEIIIEPTFVGPGAPVYVAPPPPPPGIYVAPYYPYDPYYPYYERDRFHHYNWRYWHHDRGEHEHRDHGRR